MRNCKEAGSLRMCREAVKEFDACGGRLGREWMDVEEEEKQTKWQLLRTTVAIATV